jgi:hypothetical protein
MNSSRKFVPEDAILSADAEPLKAINVGILNREGFVDQIITLEELVRVGCSQPLQMHNYGNFGEVEYEFTIFNADSVSKQVAYWRERQQNKQGGNAID